MCEGDLLKIVKKVKICEKKIILVYYFDCKEVAMKNFKRILTSFMLIFSIILLIACGGEKSKTYYMSENGSEMTVKVKYKDEFFYLAENLATKVLGEDYEVVEKTKLERLDEVEELVKCDNPKCISNHENIKTKFVRLKEENKYKCFYCEKIISEDEIQLKTK